MILAVLNETLEELQTANKSLKEMGQKITLLETRVKAFEEKEIKIAPPDLEPLKQKIDDLPGVIGGEMKKINDTVTKLVVDQCAALRGETTTGLTKIAAAVETQPKPIIRRISLFPENDREGNYKTFIRWLVGGIVAALLVGSAYVLANLWIQRSHPRWLSMPGTGMDFSTDSASPARTVPVPPKKAATARPHAHQKKFEKNLDTLRKKLIDPLLDSLGRELDSLQKENGFFRGPASLPGKICPKRRILTDT